MSHFKIALIGGGSYHWAPHLAADLMQVPQLNGSELHLVDLNPEAVALTQRYIRHLAEHLQVDWRIEVSPLEPALDGADAVAVAISTGGLEAMQLDVSIPERFGVYHTVGDTVGPGGIARTLRNVPIFVELAQQMERLCPRAWMVHVTNPLAQITRAVTRASSIRCVGLCHNYLGTRAFLANLLQCEREDLHAVSVGVNHFTWLKELTCRGQDVQDQLTCANYLQYEARKRARQQVGLRDDSPTLPPADAHLNYYLNFELCELFGYFPVGGSAHVAENFPGYLNSLAALQRHRVERKPVLPDRAAAHQQAKQEMLDRLAGKLPLPDLTDSIEQLAPVVAALLTGRAVHTVVNVPNQGQISNLPPDVVVETWAQVDWNRITPACAGAVPSPVNGQLQLIVQEEELAVEAALTGQRRLVVQALAVSPALAQKDQAEELADELLAAQARWLPQFQTRTRRSAAVVPA